MDGIFWCKRIAQCLLRSHGGTNLLKRGPSSVLFRSLAVSGIDVPGEDYQEYREHKVSINDSTAVLPRTQDSALLDIATRAGLEVTKDTKFPEAQFGYECA